LWWKGKRVPPFKAQDQDDEADDPVDPDEPTGDDESPDAMSSPPSGDGDDGDSDDDDDPDGDNLSNSVNRNSDDDATDSHMRTEVSEAGSGCRAAPAGKGGSLQVAFLLTSVGLCVRSVRRRTRR
jgi:hypothetical protein